MMPVVTAPAPMPATTAETADNQAATIAKSLPEHEKDALFELIPDGFPLLRDADVKQKLLQWNLDATLQLRRFRVKQRMTDSAGDEALIAQFFQSAHVHAALSLPPELCTSAKSVSCHKLRASVTSLAFFDRLVDAGIVTASGALRRCLDDVHDGATASDLLKDMFVNPESEHADVFRACDEQHELLFCLLRALVIGGAMCQSDEQFAPYEQLAARMYKALVAVKKKKSDASTSAAGSDVQVTSRVYAVDGVFPEPRSRFSSCFVVLDARKRWLTLWHHHFQPFW